MSWLKSGQKDLNRHFSEEGGDKRRILRCPKLSYRPENGGRKKIRESDFNSQLQAKPTRKRTAPHSFPVCRRLLIKATSHSAFGTNQSRSSKTYLCGLTSYPRTLPTLWCPAPLLCNQCRFDVNDLCFFSLNFIIKHPRLLGWVGNFD